VTAEQKRRELVKKYLLILLAQVEADRAKAAHKGRVQ
jgi:hypothetical protein